MIFVLIDDGHFNISLKDIFKIRPKNKFYPAIKSINYWNYIVAEHIENIPVNIHI